MNKLKPLPPDLRMNPTNHEVYISSSWQDGAEETRDIIDLEIRLMEDGSVACGPLTRSELGKIIKNLQAIHAVMK